MNKLVHVSFHGDTLDCIRHDDGEAYVIIKRVCENLGITARAQRRKLQESSWAAVGIKMIPTASSDGKSYETMCLRIDLVPKWLSEIITKKIKDPFLRAKLELYQVECAKALWDHFSGQGSMALAQVADRLDRICLALEERQDRSLAQLRQEMQEGFAAQERAIETRLQEQLPLALKNAPASTARIDKTQQGILKNLLVAARKRQEVNFQAVHGRLRAHLSVSSYRNIRNEQFSDALIFLQLEASKGPKTTEQKIFDEAMGGSHLQLVAPQSQASHSGHTSRP